jgi:N-acetyl-alpha-D-glucosaminyl L-malate synthase BshA
VNVGVVCYASMGGSGIVATELGKALANRGHEVHVISADQPFRLTGFHPGLTLHRVQTPSYPLFREPQYLLSVANTIVQVTREQRLQIVHAHYAVPHAAAAVLARQVLAATHPADEVPAVVTTLHGTDITIVGADQSFSEIVAYSIEQSDGVTAVSESLRDATQTQLAVRHPIAVIPNFLDCAEYERREIPGLRRRYGGSDGQARIVVHVSNFRPVKRIDSVLEVFARISAAVPATLLLVGDGPEVPMARRLAQRLEIDKRIHWLGAQETVLPLLSIADLFLLPSAQESFGLAAMEAMACEVPVVASNAGGLPEVIEDGVTGFLHPVDDVEAMSRSAIALLRDPALHASIAAAGARSVRERFCVDRVVPLYEALYERVLTSQRRSAVTDGR